MHEVHHAVQPQDIRVGLLCKRYLWPLGSAFTKGTTCMTRGLLGPQNSSLSMVGAVWCHQDCAEPWQNKTVQCTISLLQNHLHVQDFDGGKHLAHSGMNASAVYLFDRIYSLAQVSGCQKPVSSNILWTVLRSVH